MKYDIKPRELWTWQYWAHLALLSLIVLVILQLWKGGDMLTIMSLLTSIPLVAIGDIIAHTLLKID